MDDVPREYAQWALTDYGDALRASVASFLAGNEWMLYLHGWVGCRKTSIAAAVLREWRAIHCPMPVPGTPYAAGENAGQFVPSFRFRDATLNMTEGQWQLRRWRTTAVLVLDDIGATRATEHVRECLLHLIEARWAARLRTITTGNLTPTELGALEGRVASRLTSGVVLDLGKRDWRITKESSKRGDR